jgi:hypothetical protein
VGLLGPWGAIQLIILLNLWDLRSKVGMAPDEENVSESRIDIPLRVRDCYSRCSPRNTAPQMEVYVASPAYD